MAEFGKRLKVMRLDEETQSKIEQVIGEAGSEFPCLSCPSKNDCGSYKWFLKWFGQQK
jgi:hypothetical protein